MRSSCRHVVEHFHRFLVFLELKPNQFSVLMSMEHTIVETDLFDVHEFKEQPALQDVELPAVLRETRLLSYRFSDYRFIQVTGVTVE